MAGNAPQAAFEALLAEDHPHFVKTTAAPEQAGMREARLEAAARALLDATDRADSADAIARGLKALRAALASDSTERR